MTTTPNPTAEHRPVCDPHHWVSKHQPDLPIYWIDQCSLCGDVNAERMREEIAKISDGAPSEEPLSGTVFRLGSDAQAGEAWQKIVDAIPREVQSDWEAIDYLRTLIRWTLGGSAGVAPQEPSEDGVPIIEYAEGFTKPDDVTRMTVLLMTAWGKGDPRSGVSQHPASYVATFVDMARAVLAAGVAPQEPSPVASTPTVGDDSGHGGDDDRGGREDGPEDEGRSHQATVAGTPQRPSGCAECHRSEGHKMDCSHRFAAQPVLDPEKVAARMESYYDRWSGPGEESPTYRDFADDLCEAAKRGELT